MQTHDVRVDKCGYGKVPEHDRMLCHTCKNEIVRQPWMNDQEWKRRTEEFRTKHLTEENS
ncbi:MAG: hypothetical protein V4465_01410 [Patescibacteria group bacterium]